MSLLRRRRFGIGKRMVLSSNDMTTGDCYVAAYYLYCFSELVAENDNFKKPYLDQIRLLFKLANRLHRSENLTALLAKTVEIAEKDGELNRLEADTKETSDSFHRFTFDTTDIPYEYEQDRGIDRFISNDELKIDLTLINLFRCLHIMDSEYHFFSRLVANILLKKQPDSSLSLLEKIPAHVKKALTDTSQVEFLANALALSEDEINFLNFTYRCAVLPHLAFLTSELSAEQKALFSTKVLDIAARRYNALLRSNSALRAFGFIDEDGDILPDTVDCIANKSFDVFFADLIKESNCENAYNLESFNVNKNATTIMQRMLSGKENISLLLYGKPGSGKSEYAKALVAASGLKPLIFKNEAELSQEKNANNTNILCRLNLLLSINRPDTVLIIDEADTLLKTRDISFFGINMPSKSKGTVNKMLEEGKNKIIWIVNFTSQMDDSTLRRFNFSYKFEAMTKEQLRTITSTKLMPLNLPIPTNTQILGLMEKYSVTGASVDNVVKTIKSLGSANNDTQSAVADNTELVSCVKTILKENALLINGKAKMRDRVNANYDMRALNASMAPEKIVQMIKNAESFAKDNLRTECSNENGIRMLFYGVSGSGKTEFARYIAEKLSKKILLKRASDIFDKFVGGTEQNIRDAFEEAERLNAILLFDEADSFFSDRNQTQHNWERTQVNEFLTQLEEFSGIVICTTNLKHIMDSAMNRRFHLSVEFRPLTTDGIRCMLDRYFHAYAFSEDSINRLERRASVTPGDFGILASRMRFMDKEDLSATYIIDELCKMQDEKADDGCNNKIGFFA